MPDKLVDVAVFMHQVPAVHVQQTTVKMLQIQVPSIDRVMNSPAVIPIASNIPLVTHRQVSVIANILKNI